MKTIAFYSAKGGVGKTAAAVNVAYFAARANVPTLVWDLDSQAAASYLLGGDADQGGKVKKMLKGKRPVGQLVRRTPYARLDMIPADVAYRHMDRLLEGSGTSGTGLKALLQPLSESYGLVILDLPPSFSTLAESVFRAADSLFMPLVPSTLSVRTYSRVRDHFREHKLKPKQLHPFYSLVDRRRRRHREWLAHPPEALAGLMRAAIPQAAVAEQMSEKQAPVAVFSPRSRVASAYEALWNEIREVAGIG